MWQRVLQWIAVVLFLFVGAGFGLASFQLRDRHIEVSGLLAVSLLCFVLALITAHQRPKSN
jgi:hypothetical protein